jgi:MFS family permease
MDAHQVGMLFLLLGFLAVLVQGGLIRPLVHVFGEKSLLVAGNVLMVLGLLSIAQSASTAAVAVALGTLAVGSSLNGPTLTSLISKEAGSSQTGLALGNAQAISALGRVLGPAWGGWLFGWKTQAPFLLTAALVSITIAIGISFRSHKIS